MYIMSACASYLPRRVVRPPTARSCSVVKPFPFEGDTAGAAPLTSGFLPCAFPPLTGCTGFFDAPPFPSVFVFFDPPFSPERRIGKVLSHQLNVIHRLLFLVIVIAKA